MCILLSPFIKGPRYGANEIVTFILFGNFALFELGSLVDDSLFLHRIKMKGPQNFHFLFFPILVLCCDHKVVGETHYVLATNDRSKTKKFDCKDGCIYRR
jgi:hypothetical protein